MLVFVSLAMFGNYYVYDCIEPIADLLSKQLGYSDSNIGLLQGIYSFPNMLMVLVGGYLVDRLGARKAILLFGTICLAGAIVTVPDVAFISVPSLAVNTEKVPPMMILPSL